MCQRDALRRKFRLHPTPAGFEAFWKLRNDVVQLVDVAKDRYLLQGLSSITKSSRLWSELHSLGLTKTKSSDISPNLSLDEINTFFTIAHLPSVTSCPSQPSVLSFAPLLPTPLTPSPLPPPAPTCYSFTNILVSPPSIAPSISFSTYDPTTFFFLHITSETLKKALARCLPCSAGPDGLSYHLLRDSLPIIFPVILDFFNSSFNLSLFPSA